ncbi:hypothetical protein M501DRAFT_1048525 [Patellaria atrata CBS 101060]|uniref:Uncharacterized protein n=1 Tax=Patellaria atrata CBS 101060 TaxID=1346257 RepID=A0A9P4SE11_9PEZI|nr:hypothetical protein M501DRAFT_1048525 [Patellaria atrata CBS 101060]
MLAFEVAGVRLRGAPEKDQDIDSYEEVQNFWILRHYYINSTFPFCQYLKRVPMASEKDTIVKLTEIPVSHGSSEDESQRPLNSTPSAKAWPQTPIPLQPDRTTAIILSRYDAALLLVLILLATKTGLCIVAWHQDKHRGTFIDIVNELTKQLVKFNSQMTTVFTIIFVTIMNTAARRYALYKAQKGASVIELEQLQRSISLPSTVKLIWSLRVFGTLSWALIVLWSFYYLDSQATTLEYQFVNSDSFRNMYVAMNPPNYTFIFIDALDEPRPSIAPGESQGALSRASSNTPGIDNNGGMIIPDLYYVVHPKEDVIALAADTAIEPAHPGKDGWINVSKSSKNPYTSDIGQNLEGPTPKKFGATGSEGSWPIRPIGSIRQLLVIFPSLVALL